jgi:hypothetical protein
MILIFFIVGVLTQLSAIFQLYHGDHFSGGRSRRTWRETATMGKQLVNSITCGCESSTPFYVIYKAGREPTPYW